MVHGGVGIADQVDHVVAVLGAGGDADARRHLQLVLADVLRPGDLVQQQACQRAGLLVPVAFAVDGFGEHGELVAGQPAHDRFLRQRATQTLAQRLEYPVAGLVPERIVDLLEVVHVEVEQHEPPLLAQSARDRLVQQVLELHAVRHLRERVESRQVADAPLGPLALGDVAQHEDPALEARVGARQLGRGDRHGDRLAVRRADDRLARLADDALRIERRAVLVGHQRHEVETDERVGCVAEQRGGRAVRRAHPAIRRGDEHRIAHAVQQRVEVIARDGCARERLAHAFERILQCADLRHAARLHGLGIASAANALGAEHECRHGAVDPRDQPGSDPAAKRRTRKADADDERQPTRVGVGHPHRCRDCRRQQKADCDDGEDVTESEASPEHVRPVFAIAPRAIDLVLFVDFDW